jgi:hypothetical protein
MPERMNSKMFNCSELNSFYRKGRLDVVLRKFRHELNPKTFIGSGGDTCVFSYDDGKSVLKLCTKGIRYFKHFGKRGDAKGFQKHINSLYSFFVPVDEIWYEDDDIFIYKQQRCDIITSKDINKQIVIDVFRLIQFMLINDILLTDLAPHNLGLMNGHVVIFDYHGLHRLKKKGQINRENWWKRIARNLTRFISALYVPNKRQEYANLMQNCNSKVIKKLEHQGDLPSSFISLIKYLNKHNEKASIDQVVDLIDDCIYNIKSFKHKDRQSETSSYKGRSKKVSDSRSSDYDTAGRFSHDDYKDHKNKDRDYKDADYKDRDYKDADYKDHKNKDRDYKDTDYKDHKNKDRDYNDANYKDRDYKDADYKDHKNKDRDYNDANYKDRDYKDADYKDHKNKDRDYKDADYKDHKNKDRDYNDADYKDKDYKDADYKDHKNKDTYY